MPTGCLQIAWWCGGGGAPRVVWEQNHVGLMALETRSLSLENGISSKAHRLLACPALSAIVCEREWALGW